MPPVVTGAVVMAIGLNLAPIAVRSVSASAFDSWMAVLTVLCIGIVAVFTRGMLQRLLIACQPDRRLRAVRPARLTPPGLGKPLDSSPSPRRRGSGSALTTPSFNGQGDDVDCAGRAVILVAETSGT